MTLEQQQEQEHEIKDNNTVAPKISAGNFLILCVAMTAINI